MRYSEITKKEYNTDIKEIAYNGQKISVKQWIPTNDIYDLVTISAQMAEDGATYNAIKLEAAFYINLVSMFTDIDFVDGEKIDFFELYDELTRSELLSSILSAIPKTEFEMIKAALEEYVATQKEDKKNILTALQSFLTNLPAQMEQVSEIINNFSPEKYQNIIDFANAANGGRNFKTNEPIEE